MNLTLFKLRDKLKKDKSGMGSLVGVILGGVLLSTLVASGTAWYISMRANLGNTEDKLEAQTIAMSEWERLSHMSLDELEANRNNFKTPYSAGTGSQFSVSVNLGQKGTFNNGTCGGVSGGYANCFKDTTITVYRDGNRMFTTRTLPLMAGDYTRKEIDNIVSSLKNDYNSKINNLSNKLTNDYYTKSQTDSKIGALMPIGTILPYKGSLSSIPSGWRLCDGSNGTPDLRNRFLMGWGSKSVGSYVSAGLPNITGKADFGIDADSGYSSQSNADKVGSGALYYNSSEKWYDTVTHLSVIPDPAAYWIPLHIDASRSSSIYGNSSTVQPPAYVVYYIMKVS